MDHPEDESYAEDTLLSLTGVLVLVEDDRISSGQTSRLEKKLSSALNLTNKQISIVEQENEEGQCSCGRLDGNSRLATVMFVIYSQAESGRVSTTAEQLARKMTDFIEKNGGNSDVKDWLYTTPRLLETSKTAGANGRNIPCTFCTSVHARCTVVDMEEEVEIEEEEALELWRGIPDDQRTSHLALVPSPDGEMIQPKHNVKDTTPTGTKGQQTEFLAAVSKMESTSEIGSKTQLQIIASESCSVHTSQSTILSAQLRRDPFLLDFDNVQRIDMSQLHATSSWSEPFIITGCVSLQARTFRENSGSCTKLMPTRAELILKHGDTQVRTGNRNTLVENGFDNSIPMALGEAIRATDDKLEMTNDHGSQVEHEYSRIVFSPVKELPRSFQEELSSLLVAFPPFPATTSERDQNTRGLKVDESVERKQQKYTLCIAGREGFGIGFHKHNSAFFMLLEGRKKWYMGSSSSPSLDPFKTSEPTHPGFYTTKSSHKCIQQPGEILYVPDQWYHEIFNLEYTAGIQALPA